MTIQEAQARRSQLISAECPNCSDIDFYIRISASLITPLRGVGSDDRHANSYVKDTKVHTVTISRSVVYEEVEIDGEIVGTYKATDSFQIQDAVLDLDVLKNMSIKIKYVDPATLKEVKSKRFVASNTADTIVLSKPIPADIGDQESISDVEVSLVSRTRVASSAKDKLWGNNKYRCKQCGTLYSLPNSVTN